MRLQMPCGGNAAEVDCCATKKLRCQMERPHKNTKKLVLRGKNNLAAMSIAVASNAPAASIANNHLAW